MSTQTKKGSVTSPNCEAETDLLEAILAKMEVEEENRPSVTTGLMNLARAAIISAQPDPSVDAAEAQVRAAIAKTERALSDQLDAILHAPELVAALTPWFGLKSLVENTSGLKVKLSVLQMSPKDLSKDVRNDIDTSTLAEILGHNEAGVDGGYPVTHLHVNQVFGPAQSDMKALNFLGKLGLRFVFPVVPAASPRMYGGRTFGEMLPLEKLSELHEKTPEFAYWRAFRKNENSLAVYLIGNRVIGRSLYGQGLVEEGFEFYQETAHTDADLPWQTANFPLSALAAISLGTDGYARVTGKRSGGAVEDLPLVTFNGDPKQALRLPVEVQVNDRTELAAAQLGLPLLYGTKNSTSATFFDVPSVHQPARSENRNLSESDNQELTKAAQLRANLAVFLNSSLIAHHVRALTREYLGGEIDQETLETELNHYVTQLVLKNRRLATDRQKARRPLNGAVVKVISVGEREGWFEVELYLHFPSPLKGIRGKIKVRGRLKQQPQP